MFRNKAREPHKIPLTLGNFIKNGSLFICGKHIHHWLISLIILIFSIPIQYKTNGKYVSLLNGFLLIFMIHGLSYSERFIF